MNLQDWSYDHPADAVDLTRHGALNSLLDRYGGSRPEVLTSVLAHMYASGAQSAVLEYRYIDPDYRNEHSQFYSTTFRRYPSVAHRLHFFAEQMPPSLTQTNCKVVDHVGLGRGKVARMGRIRVLSAAMRCRVRVIWLWPVSRSIARAMFLIMAMACAPVPV